MKKFTIGGIASAIAVFAATTIALASPVNAAEAHAHVFKQYNQVAPTCTSQGYNAYRCECGAEQRSYISAMGHSYASKGYQTYNSSEHRMVRQCTRCGVQQYSYASHNFNTTTTAPTCTSAGKRVYRCATCGYSKTETIAATGHTYTVQTVNATCTSSGYQRRQCTKCGTTTTTTTSSALGHSYSAATCTAAKKCSRCGMTSGSALGHNYASKGYQNYSSSQHRMVRQCTRCGAQQYSYASHSYSISTTSASCTTSGRKIYKCNTCGYSKTETIAATGHNFAGSKTYSAYSASQHKIATRCTRCSAQTVSYAAHVKNTLGTSCKYCGKAM